MGLLMRYCGSVDTGEWLVSNLGTERPHTDSSKCLRMQKMCKWHEGVVVMRVNVSRCVVQWL